MATNLQQFPLSKFDGGYNSFSQSKSLVQDNEIPYGSNVLLDDNGSATKRLGRTAYSGPFAANRRIAGMGQLRNSSYNRLVAASGTQWWDGSGGVPVPLTGTSFTDDKETRFAQAFDKLYGANGTDSLAYTANAGTVVQISTFGNVGDWPVFWNGSLYMTNSANPDRIMYSNPFRFDATTNPPTITGFDDANMFNTDLAAVPKKDAGYFSLLPGSGVRITCLYRDGDILYAATEAHGLWQMGAVSAPNANGSRSHQISQVVAAGGIPSGKSLAKVSQNDLWYYGGDNVYARGEVQYYNSLRVTAKTGRVKSEMSSVATAGKSGVAGAFYLSKAYFAYQTGIYNDRVIAYDSILNAWGTPFSGWNVQQFMERIEADGTRRLLAGSSNPADPYLYQLQSGLSDNGSPIPAVFETKSTDCGEAGLKKRFAFVDVFYSMVAGTVSYQVFVDEVNQVNLAGSAALGNSLSTSVGVGSQPVGSFPVGMEYKTGTSFAALAANSVLRIYCQYTAGKRISVRFSNNNLGEQFRVNGIVIWFKSGNINER